MPDVAPLVDGTDSTVRWRDDSRPNTDDPIPVRLSELEAERDALRELVQQTKPRQMFFL